MKTEWDYTNLAQAYLNRLDSAPSANGIKRTSTYPNVLWVEGVGEDTGMVGSSFSVCDRQQALTETSEALDQEIITVPYTTRNWMAQVKR